jgi:hypothetical protein
VRDFIYCGRGMHGGKYGQGGLLEDGRNIGILFRYTNGRCVHMQLAKYIVLLLLIPSLCWAVEPINYARMNVGIVGAGGAAVEPYYYVSDGAYTDTTYSGSVSYAYAFSVAAVNSKTITSLGVYLYAVGTATECSMSLNTLATATLTRVGNAGSVFAPTTGWNNVTVSEAVTGGITYYLALQCNGTFTAYENLTVACANSAITPGSYNPDPVSQGFTAWDNQHCFGMRIGF